MPPRKLTPEQSRELYRDYTVGGMSYKQLQDFYGISEKTVWRELDRIRNLEKYRGRWANGNLREFKKLKPCGTEAAYKRHYRHGEIPCLACCAAHQKYKIQRRTRLRKAA